MARTRCGTALHVSRCRGITEGQQDPEMDWLMMVSILLVVDVLVQMSVQPYVQERDQNIEILSSLVLFMFAVVLMTIRNMILQLVLAGPLVGAFCMEWGRNYLMILLDERKMRLLWKDLRTAYLLQMTTDALPVALYKQLFDSWALQMQFDPLKKITKR